VAAVTSISWFGFPLRSHTVPSLPVVAALVRAGAAVTFHSTPRYRGMIESTGARFSTYPPTCERLECGKDLRAHVRDVAAVTATVVPALVASEPADLVVFDASAFWGRAVARARMTPSAASVTTFVFTRTMLQMIGRPAWMTDEDIDVLATAGDLKIVYTSSLFQPAGRFLDDSHVFVGPLLDERPEPDGMAVEPGGSRPLAYVSLGTIFNRNLSLLRRVAEQLAAGGWQVIVSLGGAGACGAGEWAPHVRAYPFVDQIALLEQARLVVTHGGLQTVTEALAFGIPLVVIPQDVDQHVVGRRAADLGAAIVLDSSSMTDDDVAAAVSRIDSERPQFEKAAAAIGRSFEDATPLATAVQRMLDLARPGTRAV
jgi:UDP:flavonoid glycosyltransferase YjiC (YdhE family)